MGVHGLWDLLAPVGRRVSVETLSGKKLAIDASIWMVQFMKAMRDEKGEMIRNAHLIGFFRRICKLLYLRTKPIFVFDGATPALKRRTVIARRRQRENAQAKVRKTAEKLLLNHLKAMRLKELATDLEEQRRNQKDAEKLDKGLGATSRAEEDGSLNKNASTSAAAAMTIDEDDDDEEMILPEMPENVDPAVLAALPPSMQHNLLVQLKNDAKGKKILLDDPDQAGVEGSYEGRNGVASSYNQEKLDEMLAASIAAEEDRSLTNNASSSAAAVPYEEEDGDEDEDEDEDEEMILPVMHGNIDPVVLAALPPSMQLDLLVQIRERLMAENRQKYQKVKKAPEKFSELQIQSYLKTVAFRREIDQVQKAAAGRGLGGVQTSRIASEANREFIFSSSFTGDKQVLTSASVEKNGDKQPQVPSEHRSSDSMSSVASIGKSKAKSGLVPDESRSVSDDDVVTYSDERGRFRVSKARARGHFRFSKARAMGIRMTRDLQRNLDLMKEIEQETTNASNTANAKSMLNRNNVDTPKSSGENQFVETSHDINGKFTNLNERNQQSVLKNGTSIEISFEDDGKDKWSDDDDDDLFARLAAGDPVTISSADNTPSRKQSTDSASDCDWEEAITEGKGIEFCNDVEAEIKSSIKEGDASDESEVEWEEHSCDVLKDSFSCPSESGKTVSKGYLEEEANLHEAIRRSLMDLTGEKSNYVSSDQEKSKSPVENASEGVGFFDGQNNMERSNFLGENVTQQDESFCELVDGVEKLDNVGVNISQTIDSSGRQLKSSTRHPDNKGILINGPCERHPTSDLEQLRQDASDRVAESVLPLEAKEVCFIEEQCFDDSNVGGGSSTVANSCSGDCSHAVCGDILDAFLADDKQNDSEVGQSILFDDKNVTEPEPSIVINVDKNDIEAGPSILADDKKNDTEAEPSCRSIEIADPSIPMVESSAKESTIDIDIEQKIGSERTHDNHFNETEHNADKSATKDSENEQVEFTEASLEEEMLILDQECMNLEDEQRKLERNAESVSSEMFAECQELLQMFGLPYIIAPMEAEAQCAYLELANLVDGIVTDDSDVLLFGGRSVYKNIFDDRKYVETYFMKDIEKELGLTQEKLIRMALLLGSDYTEGVSGIGIVNAIEVVNAFPEEDGLHKFREWIESPDPTILGKFDVQTGSGARKRDGKCSTSNTEGVSATDQDIFHANEDKQSADYIQEIKQIFMDKHRNVSKNWHIPSSFPSEAVIFAYSSPQVDKSTESFTWGKPDLFVLHRLCWEKFGWDSQKSDELLLPVLKEYNKRETQLRLEAFYTFNEKFAKIRSKRINEAVKGITGSQSSKLTDDAVQEVSKSRKKRRISPGEAGDNPEKPSEDSVNRNQSNSIENSTPKRFRKSNLVEKSTPKQSRKRRISGGPVLEEGKQSTNEESQGNGRGRGRGRGGGRGRGRGRGRGGGGGRGRGRGSLGFELSEPSSSDVSSSDNEQEVCVENSKGSVVLHRSTRSRKPVNYTVNDIEIDDVGKSVDQSNIICSDEEAIKQDSSLAEGICQDAAGGFNVSEHKVGNPSLEEGFCSESSDYLERGGGFCMVEGEIGQSGVNQNRESPSEVAQLSKDYLNMGGGFCLDESKTGEDQDAFDNSATATIRGTADSSHCSGFMEEADHNIGSVQPISGFKRALNGPQGGGMTDGFDMDCQKPTSDGDYSNVRVSLQENCKDDTGMTSVGGLSAMPFLRRKRRKS